MSTQYQINERQLLLRVKKAPLAIRIILYVIAIAGILLPIIATVSAILLPTTTMSIVNIIVMTALLFISLFIFRLAIWNTKGEEEFYFADDHVYYQANYGWFKDKRKRYNLTDKAISFEIRSIGSSDDHKGVLLMQSGTKLFGSAVKVPVEDLKIIIAHIKQYYK
ncbi:MULTISPECIES: hypothetical protein [Myroides]|uniref:DUF304 domain-containing protein n=1 Tax=Myroides albus TaxID=2562892 RepID=A0A6I3LQL8_9FLAO|nr:MULTISPECIES: hypothetical protein [Myroides]MTG98245.1 hypothetical protein [Myroides albus]MVX35307.1 hypothetical protein [Myroides sp. LoEW2-1]UVD79029.1 hypothetical protein NWE55_12980 [Myroides albus]